MFAIIWCRIFFCRVWYKNVNIKIHKIIIFFVAFYVCKTWSLISREERRVRVFENRVLSKLFRFMCDVVTVEWKKVHIEKLNGLYSSPNIVRVIK
jgi:hypothetical protein